MTTRAQLTATALALCLAPGAAALADDGGCSQAGASKAVHDVHELLAPTEPLEEQFGQVECAVDRVEGDGR